MKYFEFRVIEAEPLSKTEAANKHYRVSGKTDLGYEFYLVGNPEKKSWMNEEVFNHFYQPLLHEILTDSVPQMLGKDKVKNMAADYQQNFYRLQLMKGWIKDHPLEGCKTEDTQQILRTLKMIDLLNNYLLLLEEDLNARGITLKIIEESIIEDIKEVK